MTDRQLGRILVLDQDAVHRDEVCRRLSQLLFEVTGADTGEAGVAMIESWEPAVVVVPADALDTCRLIKAGADSASLPVLVWLKGAADEELAQQAVGAGASDFVTSDLSPTMLATRIGSMVARHDAETKLRQMVITDDLTGVFSRRFLFESMRQLARQLARGGPPVLACLMVDIDHFKSVNSQLGPLDADRVLRQVAQIIRGTTRGSDVVARFGGEEFCAILPATSPSGARIGAEKIRRAVEQNTRNGTPVTVSIGVSWCDLPTDVHAQTVLKSEDLILELLRRADEALARAKAQGRNRVVTQAELEGGGASEGGVPILVEVEEPNGSVYYSTELTPGGMAIQQDLQKHPGERINLVLHLDDATLPVQGEVAWTGAIPMVGTFTCIGLTDLNPGTRELLQRFLMRRMQHPVG
ncbi:MAG: diguanylate cyclase [Candidatus Xenobia bacterium]